MTSILKCCSWSLDALSYSDGPMALNNLFPVGYLSLGTLEMSSSCTHLDAPNLWRHFRLQDVLVHQFSKENSSILQVIQFLVDNKYIVCTLRHDKPCGLLLAIYLVPHDLPGMRGTLRRRNDVVAARARLVLASLLPSLQSAFGVETAKRSVFSPDKDNRTLSEIYGDLPSPHVPAELPLDARISRMLNRDDDLTGIGLWNSLYSYQRHSIAAMLLKETSERSVPDPLFVQLTSLNGREFYFQPGTMEVLQDQPRVSTCSSGVLCEELGTGKTVMILGLILATRQTLASPEESIVEERPILTPISLTLFPSCHEERARLGHSASLRIKSSVPSLTNILLHQLSVFPSIMRPSPFTLSESSHEHQERFIELLELQPHLMERFNSNTPFYYYTTKSEPKAYERQQRSPGRFCRMYLTTATLILVPVNLISQWDREIQKHCAYPLRVLIVRSKTPLPDARTLASNYDIVLMTIQRFSAEHSSKPPFKQSCQCAPYQGSKIPDCICQEMGESPLRHVRWKRLVIDEGHISAAKDTSLSPFARALSVQHRWIVTGTPTTNLLGLQFGSSSNGETRDDLTEDENEKARVWSRYDREDLRKLGSMFANFLGVQPFANNYNLFNSHVTDALMNPKGPLPGAVQVLTQLMSFVMIRHRVDDVEQDVVLPSITQEPIFLDLDPLAIKSYNAHQAALAINAVDSERTDQDYLFHPANARSLQETVENMSQLMFWGTDDRMYNVIENVRDSAERIETAKRRGVSEADQRLLQDALVHMNIAASDPLWRSIHAYGEDLPYRISDMSDAMFSAWTRTHFTEGNTNWRLVHADRLLKLRDTIIRQPLISNEALLERARMISDADEAERKLVEQIMLKKDKRAQRALKHDRDQANAKKTASPIMMAEMKRVLDAAMEDLRRWETEEQASPASSGPQTVTLRTEISSEALVAHSPHRNIRIGRSPSSKLNYIINEILQYATSEKFLIFSSSMLTLAWVGEALDLLGVKFLRFTTVVPAHVREQTVLTFETSETYRVFLMELKHGARGLNLVSASRVIFCEPVWDADVESQAIKRVHRIGQVRAVSVKTLAIRGTAEENMIHRRKMLQSSTSSKLPQLLQEAGMRHYIANPTFIQDPPQMLPVVDFKLFNVSEGPPSTSKEMSVDMFDPVPKLKVNINLKRARHPLQMEEEEESEDEEKKVIPPPKKKQATVRFAN